MATIDRLRAGVVGGGVIGGGWAARFLVNGWDVAVFDPQANAAATVTAILQNARTSAPALADVALPKEGQLTFATNVAEAVTHADWIQESVPEELDLKHQVLAEIQLHAPAGSIVGSSTSGFTPSDLQKGASRPG